MLSVPATGFAGMCDSYDLTKLEALGQVTFQVPNNYSYTLSVCENVPSTAIPAPCKNGTKSSVAYQYMGSSCSGLGDLQSSLVV